MEFSVRCHPDLGGPDIDEMIDAINESMNSIKDSILGIVQQAIDEQDGDWYDIYNEYELLEEEKPRYILDEEE
jgi:archaellum component FlaC